MGAKCVTMRIWMARSGIGSLASLYSGTILPVVRGVVQHNKPLCQMLNQPWPIIKEWADRELVSMSEDRLCLCEGRIVFGGVSKEERKQITIPEAVIPKEGE